MTRLWLIAAGLALTLLAAACSSGMRMGGTAAQSAPFDQQFIDMMVPHHEGALEMARIAEARAEHLEIKSMAADILRTQADEIAQMKAWRKAWFGSDQTPPMSRMPMVEGMAMPASGGHAGHGAAPSQSAPTMDMAADVEKLRTADAPFDRAFIDAMIAHHNDATAAGKAAETRAQRQEIKDLAKQIVEAQQREVDQLTQWRRGWYGS